MARFRYISRLPIQAVQRFNPRLSKHTLETLGLALAVCIAGNAWAADERLVKGQVYGIDRNEGVWVGIVTGERTFNDSWEVPHDDFEADVTPEEKPNWLFSSNGEFTLKTEIEEEAVLLIVGKNRLPVEVALHPNEEWKPIEVSLSSGVSVKGVVQAKDGKPVAGATISYSPSGSDFKVPLFARPTWVTAADGSFYLAGLASGSRYIVGVTAHGYAPIVIQSLAIPDDGINRLEVELEVGYFVSGKVVGADLKPLRDIDVVAGWNRVPIKLLESDGLIKTTHSDGYIINKTRTRTKFDGTFRIGYFSKGTTGRLYAGSSSTGSAISQRVIAPYDDLVLRFVQESVRGRVLDEMSGKPIENFTVEMYIEEPKTHMIESKDGVFELSVYPIDKDGNEVRISAPGYVAWTREIFRGLKAEYDLGEVRLKKERTIRGVVRDGRTGSPVANVRVFGIFDQRNDFGELSAIRNRDYDTLAITDEMGAFTLESPYYRVDRLLLLVPRVAFVSVDLPSGVNEIDIELQLDGVLEGSLVLPDGSLAKGMVELLGSSWHWPRRVSTEGNFRLDTLSPDTYTLTATTDEGLVETRTITLGANERLDGIDLRVHPGWSVKGTITGLAGAERVRISAQDTDSNVLVRKRFGNGPFTIHGLPSKVTLVAHSSSAHTLVREFLDGNEQGLTFDFHIQDESRLAGWLTSGGKPLGGISLQIKPEDSGAVAANVTTTESGRYVAHRLVDGRHVIHTDIGHLYTVDISGDTTFNIEVPENSLSGYVRGERTRLPIGGGLVKLVHRDWMDEGHPLELKKRVGSDGTFLFEGLVSGHYDILVEHPQAAVASSRIYVSGLESVELTVPCANSRECFDGPLN